MKNETNMAKVLEALIAAAPYPVYREDTLEFITNNFDKFTRQMQKDVKPLLKETIGGASFVTLTKVNATRIGKPQNFFLLEDDESPRKHVYYMLHEFGHYVCFRKKCSCEKSGSVSAEYHADCYAFEKMIEMNWFPALQHAVNRIQFYSSTTSRNRYALAARRLMKSDFWETIMRHYFCHPSMSEYVKGAEVIVISRGFGEPDTLLMLNRESVSI